jgi:hypothetical protein
MVNSLIDGKPLPAGYVYDSAQVSDMYTGDTFYAKVISGGYERFMAVAHVKGKPDCVCEHGDSIPYDPATIRDHVEVPDYPQD